MSKDATNFAKVGTLDSIPGGELPVDGKPNFNGTGEHLAQDQCSEIAPENAAVSAAAGVGGVE
jgi:hypothetical protein